MVLPIDSHTVQLVLREACYYQLAGLIQLLERQAKHLQSDKEKVRSAPGRSRCTAVGRASIATMPGSKTGTR
jgi:hypothetical protein